MKTNWLTLFIFCFAMTSIPTIGLSDILVQKDSSNIGASEANASSSNGSINVEGDKVTYYSAPGFAAAQGTDTVQLGSQFFGSVSVSRDQRSLDLRRNIGTVQAMYQANLITIEQAREFAQYVYKELKKESKPSKCFGVIPCGKERKITNLFKLI